MNERTRGISGRADRGGQGPALAVCVRHGRHQWRFVAGRDDLPVLLHRLAHLAEEPGCPLDWFDAALVARAFELEGRGERPATGDEPGRSGDVSPDRATP